MNEAISLENNATIPLSENDAIIYEDLDKKITRCAQLAEKNAESFLWVVSHTHLRYIPITQIYGVYLLERKRVADPTCVPSYAYKRDVKQQNVYWIWILRKCTGNSMFRSLATAKFKKTATFQDCRIEELALAGNSEASAIRFKRKIWKHAVHKIEK